MNALFQLVSEQEIPTLLGLMREFYADQRMRFDEHVARSGLQKLLADASLGQACFIYHGAELAGYFVVTFCFSLEFNGTFALLDELYIREPFRGRHLGQAVIAFAETVCKQTEIKALRLEVGRDNEAAQALYRACGFVEDARNLFTKWL
ncbi:MAG TPA: GNAT family N-acetyltransferase [Candidatus Angelobacter sp.]|nr:GNAT family N-acetyltransferase [Candidatus Angelobacter sp.]